MLSPRGCTLAWLWSMSLSSVRKTWHPASSAARTSARSDSPRGQRGSPAGALSAGAIVDRVEGGLSATAALPSVIDMRGVRGSAAARTHVLEDTSGRRARRMACAGRAVGALFLLWIALLTLGGLVLIPVDGIPLGRVLRPESVVAPKPARGVSAERARPVARAVPARDVAVARRDAAAPSTTDTTTRARAPRSALEARGGSRRSSARAPARSPAATSQPAPASTSQPLPAATGQTPPATTAAPTPSSPSTPTAPAASGTGPAAGTAPRDAGTTEPAPPAPSGRSTGTAPVAEKPTGASGTAPGSGQPTSAPGTAPGSGKPTGAAKGDAQGPKKPPG
jgi:hypothetical protein